MIVLPFPPATLSGHAKGNHYRSKAAVTKAWREAARDAVMSGRVAQFPDGKAYDRRGDIHLIIRFYPPNKRGDRVNFPNRCKPLFDGLADAWGVNDSRFVPHFEFHQPATPARVEVEIHPQTVGETE